MNMNSATADPIVVRENLNKMARRIAGKAVASHRINALDETRPGKPLPYIPNELWMLIIRFATTMRGPSPLSPSSTPASFLTPTHQQLNLQRYHTMMRQKLILSSVSHHFHWLTNEVLFEFIWISRASQAKHLAHALNTQSKTWNFGGSLRRPSKDGRRGTCGDFIRRLHVETSSLNRCAPADLRAILDHAPFLQIYEDHHSMRRNLIEESYEPLTSPERILFALVANADHKELKALTLTNYDDVNFHFTMAPILRNGLAIAHLQFLELHFVSSSHRPGLSGKQLNDPALLPNMTLPALRTLKVTLDNNTFLVLSNWSMPALTSLSVLSADFSYASSGFARFFEVHGSSLRQLELGHSSSSIEEHYLTNAAPATPFIAIADLCPNLREFICSADAEWNWQNPDWIAPHVLLPAHPTLELIAIRDIDKRIRDDLEIAFAIQQHSDQAEEDDEEEDESLFSLVEQISSLLRQEAFPRLQYVRDLSPEASRIRNPSASFNMRKANCATMAFWKNVLERCRMRGVWLEDCDGINLTMNELRRKARDLGVPFN